MERDQYNKVADCLFLLNTFTSDELYGEGIADAARTAIDALNDFCEESTKEHYGPDPSGTIQRTLKEHY